MLVACGSIDTREQDDVAARLVTIHRGLAQVLTDHHPQEAAVEATFVKQEFVATLKLGQARGVALLVPAQGGLRVSEPCTEPDQENDRRRWSRRKAQIRMMIGVLLPKATPQTEDAADALGNRSDACASSPKRGAAGGRVMIGEFKGILDSYGEDSSSLTSTASAMWCIARRAPCRRCRRPARR